MRKFVFICLFAPSIVLLTSLQVIAASLPVGQREYDFVYDRIEREETFARNRFDYQLGPYGYRDSAFAVSPFDSRTKLTDRQIGIFGFAAESFRASPDRHGRMYALFRGGVAAQPFKQVAILGQFYLDERLARDPNYTGKKWRGFAGDIDLAYAKYFSERFDVTAGRFSSFWGPRRSLVLGSRSHLDGFGYSLRLGRVTVSYRLGQLAQDSIGSDTTTQWPNRYFAGHRVDVHFSKTLRIGLFESVVFGGPGRSIDFAYLNPIIFFHASQLNEKVNDNTLAGVDFTWKPLIGAKCYGQLLIDDIQLDHKTQGDQEPAQYAVMVGLYTASKARKLDTRLEYTRVTNWTFNQILPRNRYVNRHDPIGDVAGNDYDITTAEIIRWLRPNLSVRIALSYQQQGEGRINADWTEPWLDIVGDYREPFPTGTVEKTKTLSLGLRGFVNSFLFVDTKAGLSRIVNYDNHAGDKRTLPFVDCYLSLYFSKIIGLD
jgi:hypothetical protein